MLVGEIMERLKKGDTMKDIAEELGVHNATITDKIRALGYSGKL